jgi:hypothetical protein
VKVELARVPMLVTAVIQTTIMSDNITAYSTAVGPSSLFKKRLILLAKFFILVPSDRYFGLTEREHRNRSCNCHAVLIAMIPAAMKDYKLLRMQPALHLVTPRETYDTFRAGQILRLAKFSYFRKEKPKSWPEESLQGKACCLCGL